MTYLKRTKAETQNETRENTMFGDRNTLSSIVIPEKPQALSGIRRNIRRSVQVVAVFAVGLILAPNTALADDECGLQVGTTPVDCGDASYGSGVTYDAVGDLFIDFTNSFRSMIGTSTGGDGIDLNATGGDSITFDSATTNTEIESNGTAGALLSVTTTDGNIDIDTEEMDADESAANVTHAIYAESTGSGSIDITTTGPVDASSSGGSGTNPADAIGIQAITTSGSLTVTASGAVRGNDAAIEATTGTGLLTVNVAGDSSTGGIGGGSDIGIRTDSGGGTIINVAAGGFISNGIQASGSMLTLNNNGSIGQAGGDVGLDFSGLADGYTFNNNAGALWNVVPGVNTLGTGALNNAGTIRPRGAFNIEDIGDPDTITVISAPGSTFTGTGDSTLDMTMFLNGTGQTGCASVTVAGCLDLQGGATAGQTSILVRGQFTTLVTGPLTTVTSANPGIVLVDVGGGTSGADDFVLHPDSTLVEVGSGPLAPAPVVTAAYATDPIYGAVLDTSLLGDGSGGIFDYALLYNPNTQQHLLASVPQSQAIEYVSYIGEAMSIWHTTTDTIVGRQAALRDGATGKLWARYVGDSTDYDASPSFTSHGNTFVYDQPYSLDTKALIIGLDLISGDDRAFGVHGGLIDSRAKFDETGTSDNSEGVTAGLYGAWWHESGLSLDGAVNLNSLTIDHGVSGDFESGDSDVRSLGARVEAGWRLPLMEETLYVQPLATAAYVLSDFDDVDLRDNEISFEDTESSRAGLGARVGGAINLTDSRYQRVAYWLTARAWEEYADEGETRFATRDGGHLSITDDRSGSFEEVDFGVELTNKEGNINVHFAGGVKFGDEIDSSSHFSIGARMNW